ncbi:MAG: DUF1800 domain-containing protein [Pseudonocardiales bacterium]
MTAEAQSPRSGTDVHLTAHLLRRTGFGEDIATITRWSALSYQDAVDAILAAADAPAPRQQLDEDLIARYLPAAAGAEQPAHGAPSWVWRMLTTGAALRERIALFWHSLLATGSKFPMHTHAQLAQIDLFRRFGLGGYGTLLREVSRDPAMIVWLDNGANHRDAPNENYGRELLELFTLGRGHYTESDVKAAARAFTGWQLKPMISYFPWGPVPAQFHYDPCDHDDTVTTFLGRTGRFAGEDIIDALIEHPATATFVARRLYTYFVADTINLDGERLIRELADVFAATGGHIGSMLRTLLLSEHFRSLHARYARVKNPVEFVIGFARALRTWSQPGPEVTALTIELEAMGQSLLHPPSVAGWPEGENWIDGAGLFERINHATSRLSTPTAPAARTILSSVRSAGPVLDAAGLVTACLRAFGAIELSTATFGALVDHVRRDGEIDFVTDTPSAHRRTLELAQAIAAAPDFQYC